jgi:ABC-type ATPase involved in cell division
MGDPLLVFEDVVLRSEEGKTLFEELEWSIERSAKINLRTSSRAATALFKLAAGVLHPQKGQVILDGTPLGPYAFDHPFLHRGALGWVPRDGGLLVNMSLLGNVALPLLFVKDMSHSEAEAKAMEALEQAGLGEVADHRPHALDSSERWMGTLVRAWVMEPELWLVDPLTGTLHRRHQETAAALLDQIASSPATLIASGEESWMPWISMQVTRLDHGKLAPGEHDAVRT